ncbi:hypothetical protein KFK09_002561 [Dendrobium nobile]|uniref:Uncharacterized protein n=1 Tax=Dendrobium nobile TaxID=94219 RepID=A0A8T3C591_DENNO|nr:hypothetical protein KFK09_002561 [Dendrobium nobile]
MGKKRNASAAGTSISRDIHDLRTLNSDLIKEVAELRKQIEHLCSRLDSLIADRDIPDSINRDIPDSTDRDIPDSTDRDISDSTDGGVLGHVLSSTLGEAEAHSNAQIADATYKDESATAEPNAIEIPLLREQDAIERELELIIEGSDLTQYSHKGTIITSSERTLLYVRPPIF